VAGPTRNPVGLAYEWVGRILAAVLMMVGPAWISHRYLGPGPWTLMALALGVIAGTGYLIMIVRAVGGAEGNGKSDDDD